MANFPTIAIGLPFVHAGELSPQAQTYRANVIANGGTISDSVLKIFDAQFFIPAATNGNILNNADVIRIFKGQGNQIAANTNIVGSGTVATAVGGISWANNQGYISDGVLKYINHNFNLNGGTKFLQDDNKSGIIITNWSGSIGALYGCQQGTNSYYNITGLGPGSAIRSRNMLGAAAIGASITGMTTNTSAIYITGTKRNASNSQTTFFDTTTANNSEVSATPSSNSIFQTCQNFQGSPTGTDGGITHLAFFAGNYNFDEQTFKTLCTNLWTALGV
jgi:hypothetical protein